MALIARENGFLRNVLGVLIVAPILIVGIPIAAIATVFSGPAKLSADEVADYIRAHLDGTGGDWDWDDFTSVKIADPVLEAIRRDADGVPDLLDNAGRKTLRDLLDRVEAYRVGTGSPPE